MKKAISILLALMTLISLMSVPCYAVDGAATIYVDADSGDDANSGTSPDSAFKTIAKAGSLTYGEGDKILFKKGCIFSGNFAAKGSGTVENPITLGSYGEGAAPVFTSNVEKSPVVYLYDVSHWVVSDIDITTPVGTGIIIRFANTVVSDIKVENVSLHGIMNFESDNYHSSERAAIIIDGYSVVSGTHCEDILVTGCEIYDCSYGIHLGGNFPNTPEKPYNKNIIVENCSIHDLWDDAFIMARTDTAVLRNSTVINTCQSSGIYYTAPVWMWGVTNALVENCEIAGAKNMLDGMAVDFDDHTDNSTYQYIYSHDNTMFMWNCPYDSDDHYNNTVRYCLSVNDNRGENGAGYSGVPEHNFKFYNNTIVNGCSFRLRRYDNAVFQNNIFSLIPGEKIELDNTRTYTFSNNCYYGVLPTKYDKNSFLGLPQFAGKDYTDKNSFMLKAVSPLIGAGTKADDDMGTRDFYGNELTDTHNIGCYEGSGVEGEKEIQFPWTTLYRILLGISRALTAGLKQAGEWIEKQFKKL